MAGAATHENVRSRRYPVAGSRIIYYVDFDIRFPDMDRVGVIPLSPGRTICTISADYPPKTVTFPAGMFFSYVIRAIFL
jgi:hypothetical protein